MIPEKKSSKWINVFILYTIVVFISFLSTRLILGSDIFGMYILSLIGISVGSALIPCVGGYLGKRMFFIIYTLCAIIGILYMFYVVTGNTAPGWGDLTSIVGFLFMVAVGIGLALVTEIVIYFVKRSKTK